MADFQKYKQELENFASQLISYQFTFVNLKNGINLTEIDIETQRHRLSKDHDFLLSIHEALVKSIKLLEEEKETVDFGQVIGNVIGGVILGLLVGAAVNAANQKKVYVNEYRRKDGTHVKGHYKTVHTAGALAIGSALNNLTTTDDYENSEKPRTEKEVLLDQYFALILEVDRKWNLVKKYEDYLQNLYDLQRYKKDFDNYNNQLLNYKFTKLNLKENSTWLPKKDVEIQFQKIQKDENFLSSIYLILVDIRGLLSNEKESTEKNFLFDKYSRLIKEIEKKRELIFKSIETAKQYLKDPIYFRQTVFLMEKRRERQEKNFATVVLICVFVFLALIFLIMFISMA